MRNTNRSLLSNRLLTWYARTHASLPQCSIDFPSILLSITARTKAIVAPSSRATQAFFPLKRRELWKECGWEFHFTHPETRIASEEKTPRWLCSCHLCSWETFFSVNDEAAFPIAKCYFSNKMEEEVADRRGEGKKVAGSLVKTFFNIVFASSILPSMIICGWTICRFVKTISELRMKIEDQGEHRLYCIHDKRDVIIDSPIECR